MLHARHILPCRLATADWHIICFWPDCYWHMTHDKPNVLCMECWRHSSLAERVTIFRDCTPGVGIVLSYLAFVFVLVWLPRMLVWVMPLLILRMYANIWNIQATASWYRAVLNDSIYTIHTRCHNSLELHWSCIYLPT